jgi:hypothetical protein
MKKRMGYLKLKEEVEMSNLGLEVRAYSKRGKFLGRLEINRAGVEPFIGVHGTKSLGNMSWERFFERLSKKKKE